VTRHSEDGQSGSPASARAALALTWRRGRNRVTRYGDRLIAAVRSGRSGVVNDPYSLTDHSGFEVVSTRRHGHPRRR
jgi:hypothetical protein